MQLSVSNGAGLSRFVSLPDNRRLIAAALEVPVKTVLAYVKARPLEPPDLCRTKIPRYNTLPRLLPGNKLLGLFGPKALRDLLLHKVA